MSRRKCDFPGELLSAYLDDEVSESESMRVERHLRDCAHCRCHLEELRLTSDLLSESPSRPAPTSFRRQLRSDLLRQRGGGMGAGRARMGSLLRRVTLVAAVVLLFLLPLAGLYSHMMMSPDYLASTPAEEREEMPEMEAMEPEPEAEPEPRAEPESPPEELEVAREEHSELIALQVPDVQEGTAALTALADAVEAEVYSHEQHWDREGRMKESVFILQVDPARFEELREGVLGMGTLVRQRVGPDPVALRDNDDEVRMFGAPEEAPDIAGASLRVVMKIDEEMPLEVPREDISLLRDDPGEAPYSVQLRTAAARSWEAFGAQVAGALLWMAGHIPHLSFAFVLLITLILALSILRREDSA